MINFVLEARILGTLLEEGLEYVKEVVYFRFLVSLHVFVWPSRFVYAFDYIQTIEVALT